MTDGHPRVRAARSRSLVSGSAMVAGGLAAFGLSTYVFTAITARAVGPEGFGDFSVFWSTLYGVGLGVAIPIEQETSRRVAEARHHGRSTLAPVIGMVRPTILVMGVATLVASTVLTLVAEPGSDLLLLWGTIALGFGGLAAAYLTRGALSGVRRYGRYSIQLAVEGLARLLLVGGLTLAAVTDPWPYAAAVGVALLLATAVTIPLQGWSSLRGRSTAPPKAASTVVHSGSPHHRNAMGGFVAMTVAAVTAQSLVNFGPVVVRLLDPAASATAGAFLAAALIARTPTFAFAAVQAVLIPRLVETLGHRDIAAYRQTLRLVLLAVAGLTAVAVVVCALAGPELLLLFTGPGFSLPRFDIVLLAVSTGLYLVTLTLQPAAIALRRHNMTAWAWLFAAVVFVAMCLVPGDPVRVTNLAMCTSLAVASAALWVIIRRGLARNAPNRA